MLKTIVIRPAQGLSPNITLTGSYWHPKNKEQVTLTLDKQIITGATRPEHKKFIYKFSKFNREYRIQVDSNNPRGEAELKFWSKHPHIKTAGSENEYMTHEMYNLEVLEDIEKATFEINNDRLRVMNEVNKMSETERYNLCFFFGGNPTKMTKEQVWNDLISMEGGRLMEKDNIKKFFDITSKDKREELSMRTTIKKAINKGVIITESNKYWTKQRDLLGMTEDDIYAYYMGHKDAFAFIKQEVEELKPEAKKSK